MHNDDKYWGDYHIGYLMEMLRPLQRTQAVVSVVSPRKPANYNCEQCGQPMQCICKQDVPPGIEPCPASFSAFQFYRCGNCALWGAAARGTWHMATISGRLSHAARTATLRPSLPDWEALDHYAPELADEICALVPEQPWELYNALTHKVLGYQPHIETVMGGYAKYLQAAAATRCPQCNQQLELLLQLDSHWGDMGVEYIFFCPQHEEVFDYSAQSL